jgi:hypothetical protein
MTGFVSHINALLLKVFGNSVLRIFEPKREEVIGGWRRMRSKQFHKLCSSPNEIKVIILEDDD